MVATVPSVTGGTIKQNTKGSIFKTFIGQMSEARVLTNFGHILLNTSISHDCQLNLVDITRYFPDWVVSGKYVHYGHRMEGTITENQRIKQNLSRIPES